MSGKRSEDRKVSIITFSTICNCLNALWEWCLCELTASTIPRICQSAPILWWEKTKFYQSAAGMFNKYVFKGERENALIFEIVQNDCKAVVITSSPRSTSTSESQSPDPDPEVTGDNIFCPMGQPNSAQLTLYQMLTTHITRRQLSFGSFFMFNHHIKLSLQQSSS